MRSPLRLILAIALLAAATLVAASGAGAQTEGDFGVTTFPTGNPDQAVYDFEVDGITCQSDTIVTVDGVPGATFVLADPNSGTISLPIGTPGGLYDVIVTCDAGKGTETARGGLSLAAVTVDKMVEGEVPADATFPVTVSCSRGVGIAPQDGGFGPEGSGFLIDTSFSFGATGGSKYLVAYTSQGCTITETDDGGALSATIDLNNCDDDGGRNAAAVEAAGPSGTFDIVDPTDCTQTITNVFAAPAAQPADVVQQQPSFTG